MRGRQKEFGESSFLGLYRNYIKGANKRKISFELTLIEFREFTKKSCGYCGCLPTQTYKHNKNCHGEYTYNGIDRIDNTQGYFIENCIPCCRVCNYAKAGMTEQEFDNWIRKVYHHRNIL